MPVTGAPGEANQRRRPDPRRKASLPLVPRMTGQSGVRKERGEGGRGRWTSVDEAWVRSRPRGPQRPAAPHGSGSAARLSGKHLPAPTGA